MCDLAERVAGKQRERGGGGLLCDPHRSWFDDAVTGDLVCVGFVLDHEGDDIAALQFMDVEKWGVGRGAMSTENNVPSSSC